MVIHHAALIHRFIYENSNHYHEGQPIENDGKINNYEYDNFQTDTDITVHRMTL
jgi:hypothetical protein